MLCLKTERVDEHSHHAVSKTVIIESPKLLNNYGLLFIDMKYAVCVMFELTFVLKTHSFKELLCLGQRVSIQLNCVKTRGETMLEDLQVPQHAYPGSETCVIALTS